MITFYHFLPPPQTAYVWIQENRRFASLQVGRHCDQREERTARNTQGPCPAASQSSHIGSASSSHQVRACLQHRAARDGGWAHVTSINTGGRRGLSLLSTTQWDLAGQRCRMLLNMAHPLPIVFAWCYPWLRHRLGSSTPHVQIHPPPA